MTNPYESPKTPSEPTEPEPITARAIGMFVGGFLLTMVLTFFGSGTAIMFVVASRFPDPLAGIVVVLCSPAVVGPVLAILFWRLYRVQNRPFAIGAVTFGVSAFLLMGGCFLAFNM